MEKNHSSTDLSAVFVRALSLPHFDEDATLLSARPVVPLHEVRAETRSRRRVVFGLTILTAILGGAMGASLMLMQSGQKKGAVEAGVSQLEVLSSGAAGRIISESAESKVPVLTEPIKEPSTRQVSSAASPSIKKRQTGTISGRSMKSATTGSPDQEPVEDFESDERSLRRGERRNARREARRQLRHGRERTGDDLLRIREIFEGSPRP